MIRLIAVSAYLFLCSTAWAATYNLASGSLPGGCARNTSTNTVTCGNLTLSSSDSITISSGSWLLNITGSASLGGAAINNGGSASQLTVRVASSLTTGTGFTAKANFEVAGSTTIGSSNQIVGNLSVTTLTVGSSSTITGNVQATGAVTNHGSVIGYISAKGCMSNNGSISGDANSPCLQNNGTIGGTQCSINDNVGPCGPVLTCFNDDFNSASAFPQNWTLSTSSGSFVPTIASGRVRLTEAAQDQATRITMNRRFPAANNRVEIEFDYYSYAGNSADGIAVVFSDATVTPQSGGFGGSLGYAQRTDHGKPGFAGGWLGIGMDEYGNFARAVEGRVGGYTGSLQPDRLVIRGSASSQYRYITRSGTLSPGLDKTGTSAGPGHRYKIIIDSTSVGQSLVSVLRNTGSGFVEIISPLDILSFGFQQNVPEKLLLSFTGSTGDVYNRHELDNLQVCAALSEPIVLAPDHYRIEKPPKGYFCGDASIKVKACDDAACNTLYSNPAGLTLTTNKGSWDNSNLNINGEITAKLRVDQSLADGSGVALVTMGGINPSPSAPVYCYSNGLQTDCKLSFEAMALAFSQGSKNRPFTAISSKNAQTAFTQDIYVGLAAPESCEADLSGQSLLLSMDCADPAVCHALQFRFNGNAVSEGNYINTQLTFDSQGFARIPANSLRYDDAGTINLLAKNSDQDAEGVSNNFVVKPTNLLLSAVMDNPHVAGKDFNIRVEAVGAAGQITPNYNVSDGINTNSSDLQVRLEKLLPASIGSQGRLSLGSIQSQNPGSASFQAISSEDSLSFSQGVGQAIVNYSEVGQIRLTVRDRDYQGAGSIVSNSQTLTNFIPAYFSLPVAGDVQPGCGEFTYMGQEFAISGQVEARNLQGVRTANYFGSLASGLLYARLSNGSTEVNRLQNTGPFALNWNNGLANFSQSLVFSRATAADGPFANMLVGVLVQDDDGVQMQPPSTGFVSAVALENRAEFEFRYGRARLINAYGPETENLPVPLEIQYYNNGVWQLNQQDSCTRYQASKLVAGTMTTRVNGITSGDETVDKGKPVMPQMSFVLDAPGVVPGTNPTSLEWQVDDWLKFNWTGAGPSNPTAIATFGTYRGNDRLIFQREVF